MANHGRNTTDGYSFRFFSPEQIDQILREGIKRGRVGSHSAIERILKHEPGLERAELWQQIRRIKRTSSAKPYQRTSWGPEDDDILRKGYAQGWNGKREAVRELLKRHPSWQPHTIWIRAAKLGLVGKTLKKGRLRSRQRWVDDDDRLLLSMAGYKTTRFIAKALHRSESAVRYRLAVLGKSSRVYLDGYAPRTLARELHMGIRTIRRLIVEGFLEARDPRITRKSLDEAFTKGLITRSTPNPEPEVQGPLKNQTEGMATAPLSGFSGPNAGGSPKPPRSSRAKRIWSDVAKEIQVDPELIEQLLLRGVLKLYDSRVTERSVARFCARYGAVIKTDFLDSETRKWLADTMDLALGAGKAEAQALEAFRKHARVVRKCQHCGRTIRGNAFFRHAKRCEGAGAQRS